MPTRPRDHASGPVAATQAGRQQMHRARGLTRPSGSRVRTMVFMVFVAFLALSAGAGAVAADGGRDHRIADNTFTKWITTFPNMAGVVGGDVGAGTYAGEILTIAGDASPTNPLLITADYHFFGARHSFTARVHIVQIGADATISGAVTDGWLKGNRATGEYTAIACPQGTCFEGTLDILRGSKSGD